MTYARISSRERRDFFSGVTNFRPVIWLICPRTSSAAAMKSASGAGLESAGGGVTEASWAGIATPPRSKARLKKRGRSPKQTFFQWQFMSLALLLGGVA